MGKICESANWKMNNTLKTGALKFENSLKYKIYGMDKLGKK